VSDKKFHVGKIIGKNNKYLFENRDEFKNIRF
jgi:hypothetical protein